MTICNLCTKPVHLGTPEHITRTPLSPLYSPTKFQSIWPQFEFLRPFRRTPRRRRRRWRQWRTVGDSGSTPATPSVFPALPSLVLSHNPSPPVPSRDHAIKARTEPNTLFSPLVPRRASRAPRAVPRCPEGSHAPPPPPVLVRDKNWRAETPVLARALVAPLMPERRR